MDKFNYTYPIHVYFGQGCMEESLRKDLKSVGKHVMLAYGGGSLKRTGLYDKIMSILREESKEVIEFSGIMPNPTYAKVQEGARLAREKQIDFILAVGGGSVSDCCKIVSAQALLDEDIWEMENTHRRFPTRFIPMGIIVTASGTGSEQNAGAVITHEEKKLKNALWGALATFAILDADLTKTVPMKQVISGAFDTLSHCMETYFGKPSSSNVSDEINEAIMRNVIRNMRSIKRNPDDDFARGELMWDAAMGENGLLKLGKVTDFQCHMIEHQLGAFTDCNHGQGLAAIHPALYRYLITYNLEKFVCFAEEVWCVERMNKTLEEIANDGIDALADFISEMGLPITLSAMGITDENILRQVADTTIITPGCCKQLTPDEIFDILVASK